RPVQPLSSQIQHLASPPTASPPRDQFAPAAHETSALLQKRTSERFAWICPLRANSDLTRCNNKAMPFDHLAGGCKQRGWDVDADRLCGLEIDDRVELPD